MKSFVKFPSMAIACIALTQDIESACTELRWLIQYPAQSPTARQGHAMAYDSFRGVTILFGGLDTNDIALDDTWQFDAHGWKRLTPPHSPPPRYRHTLSYDASRGSMVLFGGRDATSRFDDTWEWNGSDWQSVSVTNAPEARFWHGMTFDSTRGVHVMFGGFTTAENNETWEYHGTTRTWTMVSTFGPSARRGMSLAFDSGRNQTLLFGGYTSSGATVMEHYLDDTWTWDSFAGFWTRQSTRTVPQGRALYSLAYDAGRGVTLMQNGEMGYNETTAATVRESWEWNGSEWSDTTAALGYFCCPRREAAMVYELAHQRMILFAGSGAYPDTTWTLEPVWSSHQGMTVAWQYPAGTFPNQYQTVRQALNAAGNCTFIDIRAGDYNETASGAVPLVITKAVSLDAFYLFGDAQTNVRIH